ncbi:MAG TPA: hypothetical protein VHZ24_14415 [Pirellulales bacterium]|jgi:predicted DNA-binding antitoxin AbrB/MazE fold protein|nr:hypothetical protein [Pirellulales bacterium]
MEKFINATFVDGVFKPSEPIVLPAGTASVIIESNPDEKSNQAWDELQRLRRESPINSGGSRTTRDEMHERR